MLKLKYFFFKANVAHELSNETNSEYEQTKKEVTDWQTVVVSKNRNETRIHPLSTPEVTQSHRSSMKWSQKGQQEIDEHKRDSIVFLELQFPFKEFYGVASLRKVTLHERSLKSSIKTNLGTFTNCAGLVQSWSDCIYTWVKAWEMLHNSQCYYICSKWTVFRAANK